MTTTIDKYRMRCHVESTAFTGEVVRMPLNKLGLVGSGASCSTMGFLKTELLTEFSASQCMHSHTALGSQVNA